MKRITLGVIVGHSRAAQGAMMPNKMTEYVFNSRIAQLMNEYVKLQKKNVDVMIIFRDGIGIGGAYKRAAELKCDAVIELHFNAVDGKVAGTETLCSNDPEDIKLASFVQEAMCRVFERKGNSRGIQVKKATDRGGQSVTSFLKKPNCLVEPFFGDNPKEMELALQKQEKYAECLVHAVEKYFASLTP